MMCEQAFYKKNTAIAINASKQSLRLCKDRASLLNKILILETNTLNNTLKNIHVKQ